MRAEGIVRLGSGLCAFAVGAAMLACEESAGPELYNGMPTVELGTELALAGLPNGKYEVSFSVVDMDSAGTGLLADMGLVPRPIVELWRSPRVSETFELATDFGRKSVWAGRLNIVGLGPDDPRLPALVVQENWGDTYADNMDMIRYYSPRAALSQGNCPAGPCWFIQHDLDYIGPNAYWMAMGLVRYATKVNGLPDQLEMYVEGEVQEPDSLIPMPFNPGGYPEHQADWWVFSGDGCPDVPAGANPFIFGHFRTGSPAGVTDPRDPGANFDGETDADWCFTSAGVWTAGGVADSPGPFAPNEPKSFDLPQYNYFVIWGYDKDAGRVKYEEPWFRAQIGVDIDLAGNPIPLAYAPFPMRPGREGSKWASYSAFLADSRVAPGAGRATFRVTQLPAFSGLEYQVWLYHQLSGAVKRVPVSWVEQRPDTLGVTEVGEPIIEWVNVSAPASVRSFTSRGPGMRHVLELSRAVLRPVGAHLKDFTHAIVTVGKPGTDADPTKGGAVLSFRYVDPRGTEKNFFDDVVSAAGDVAFTFVPGEPASRGASWKPFGAGNVEFSADLEFGLILKRIARPPMGWYYEVWLVALDEKGRVVKEKNLGPLSTPAPEFSSLRDADVSTGELVTKSEILKAAKYARASDAAVSSLTEFTHIWVTLEPKDGAENERSPFRVFSVGIPPELGKLRAGGS